MRSAYTYRLFLDKITRMRLGLSALLFAGVCMLFVAFPQVAFADTEDATFFIATYSGDTTGLPGSLSEVESCVSGYSSGINISGALNDPQDHAFSSTGLSGDMLIAYPTVEQIQAVYSFDPSTQYIIWYVTKHESDGWHVDGALISYPEQVPGENPDPVDTPDPDEGNSDESDDPSEEDSGDSPDSGEEDPIESDDPSEEENESTDEVSDNENAEPETDSTVDSDISDTHQQDASSGTKNDSPSEGNASSSDEHSQSQAASSANSDTSRTQEKNTANTNASSSNAQNSNSEQTQTTQSDGKSDETPTNKGLSAEDKHAVQDPLSKSPSDISKNPVIQACHIFGACGMAAALAAAAFAIIASLSGALKAQAIAGKIMKGHVKK